MTHIELLIINQVRKSLDELQRTGVGYIVEERSNSIIYRVDNAKILVQIGETDKQ